MIDKIISKRQKIGKKSTEKTYYHFSRKKKIAYIKDQKWKYEKEYRIVFDENEEDGLIFENDKWFMSVKITNIYLGVNFRKNDVDIQKAIINACKKNDVHITQMELSDKDYSLRVSKANQPD